VIVTTAAEVLRASRLGEPIPGSAVPTAHLVVSKPDWWEPGFVQLRLPAARLLARKANAAHREAEREAVTAEVVVGEIVPPKRRPRRLQASARQRALPAG